MRGDPRLPIPEQIETAGMLDWAKRLVLRLYDRFRDIDLDMDKMLGFHFFTPSSVTLTVGTSTSTVSDVQTLLDGNVYDLVEAAATPGHNVEFTFAGITRIRFIYTRMFYDGSGTHATRIQLYNYTTTAYDTFHTVTGDHLDYETYQIMVPDSSDYVSSGAAKVRYYHTEAGNASHDLYIDYLALVR